MFTILVITIIIALAMACCFLYAKCRELASRINSLADINKNLLEIQDLQREMGRKDSRVHILSAVYVRPDRYEIHHIASGSLVAAVWDKEDIHAVVKIYHDDDSSYNQRCAEELCDKLNEKY